MAKMNLSIQPAQPLQNKSYPINSALKPEFLKFCKDKIRPSLALWGIESCAAWTVEDANGLSLVVTATPHDNHPWEGITGLTDFLKPGPDQVITEVASLKIP